MKINSSFGRYSNVEYYTVSKEGTICLHSYYSHSFFFGTDNVSMCFKIGGKSDLVELNKGLRMALWGFDYGFSNYEGVYVFISREDKEIKIQYGNGNTGKMNFDEVNKLFHIIKDILRKIGVNYSEVRTITWVNRPNKRR